MARPESVAKAGFYPMPLHLVEALGTWVRVTPSSSYRSYGARPLVLDPCAGEGEAVELLAQAVHPADRMRCALRAIELDEVKAADLAERVRDWRREEVLAGDLFAAVVEPALGVDVLLLNPPYDVDPEHGRLEERFLRRTLPWVRPLGVVAFVVPFYALGASAETLGRFCSELVCLRFPEADFKAFRQVVVLGVIRQQPRVHPDRALVEQVKGWARSVEDVEVLAPQEAPAFVVPASGRDRLLRFEMGEMDIQTALESFQPWGRVQRGGAVDGVLSAFTPGDDEPMGSLLERSFPLATPPRAAHMAAALAAGVFNGCRVRPAEGELGPTLLVKGTFTRAWRRVEDKVNRDGEKTGEVQVQQPQLGVTVLDLDAGRYHVLQPRGERTGSRDPATMTIADLLDGYGPGLMAALLEQCPVMEPEPLTLPPLRRELYPAQRRAARTAAHLLRHGDAVDGLRTGVALQGEIGSGKTTVALATMAGAELHDLLVLCPPHLTSEWVAQAQAVHHEVEAHVLDSFADLAALPQGTPERPVVAVLSRERAKLGHAYASATGRGCPRCGAPIEQGKDHARRRTRCKTRRRRPKNRWAHRLLSLVDQAAPIVGDLSGVVAARYPRTPQRARALDRWSRLARSEGSETIARRWQAFQPQLRAFAEELLVEYERRSREGTVFAHHPCGDSGRAAWVAEAQRLGVLSSDEEAPLERLRAMRAEHKVGDLGWLRGLVAWALWALNDAELLARGVAAMLTDRTGSSWDERGPEHMGLKLMVQLAKHWGVEETRSWGRGLRQPHWVSVQGGFTPAKSRSWAAMAAQLTGLPWKPTGYVSSTMSVGAGVTGKEGRLRWDGAAVGTPEALVQMLDELARGARFVKAPECAEPLFQAVPEPRRYPLARFISRYYPRRFDGLIIDEGHEYANRGTAQEVAASQLYALGLPTLLLSGSLSNGYARSLFTNLWALSERFRRDFGRDEETRFVDVYGYRKRVVQAVNGKGKVVAFGAQSDRRQLTRERSAGQAPGVLPLLLLRHLLAVSVTLQKADLDIALPELEVEPHPVALDAELRTELSLTWKMLTSEIASSRFDPVEAGKLWGAVAHFEAAPDLLVEGLGNTECEDGSRAYEVRYPESVGGALVAAPALRPADQLTPKERAVLARAREELEEGRRCLVFVTSRVLATRYQQLLAEHLGERVEYLDPMKVSTSKRDAWIRRKVVKPGRRVLVVNPAAVQTGLNSLTHFCTALWVQNPGCKPQLFEQANGRIWRIGQDRLCRVVFFHYVEAEGCLQEGAHNLLLHKVGVMRAVDGLDPEAALEAAGVLDDDGFTSFSVGKALYEQAMRGRCP